MIEGPRKLLDDIERLLRWKTGSGEQDVFEPGPTIDHFIETELERLDEIVPARVRRSGSVEQLNELFRATLREVG